MRHKRFEFFIAKTVVVLTFAVSAAAQSGGDFVITRSVIAPGGTQSSAGDLTLDATIGQPDAGSVIGFGGFAITSGFWNYTPLAPTAASVPISGRVLSPEGLGVPNAVLYLQTQEGSLLTTRSSSLGYYRFDAVIAGQSVLISVQSKRYSYASQVLMVSDEVTGLDFVPEPPG